MVQDSFYQELIGQILKSGPSKDNLSRMKNRLAAKYRQKSAPTDIDVMMHAREDQLPLLEKYLLAKPSRSISGVTAVAIMTAPRPCPHGRCSMCPGGPDSSFSSPQSYTGHEPAALRGIRNKYDPYLQVFNRLEQYVAAGHMPQKAELIIMGGTFPSFPRDYQDGFIAYALKAMNDFSDMFFSGGKLDIVRFKEFFMLPGEVGDESRTAAIHKALLGMKGSCGLASEQERNESAAVRCVAMCVETRPDFCGREHVDRMLTQGVTRVELGVQSLYDDVLKRIDRGHDVSESAFATRLLKDSFLKVGYHMMIGLPGSDAARDKEMFASLFSDERFMPDALKIYPCMVMRGTRLHEDWSAGRFVPLTTEEAARVIAGAKTMVPPFCRIMRVQRDIPTKVVSAGVDRTNLRQYVITKMELDGSRCRCIRCREPGHRRSKDGKSPLKIEMARYDYEASGGHEIFLAAEDKEEDILAGFCRLRIPSDAVFRPEITPRCAGVRELHVYGRALGIGEKARAAGKDVDDKGGDGKASIGDLQHTGWGKRLLSEAERIAREDYDSQKMLVISGIGTRDYYAKLGYRKSGAYMGKDLD